MSIHITNYAKHLEQNSSTKIKSSHISEPKGALGDIGGNVHVAAMDILPLNTNIIFDNLSMVNMSTQPGLSDLQEIKLPKKFNWAEDGKEKSKLLSGSGNQMLCGSCWAISTANIVADNHIVAGTVNFKPNLSTTFSLACFPQKQCQGGNPAALLENVYQHGLASNYCVDYSWCATNDLCNGNALKHFKESKSKKVNLSQFIPPCGCYDGDTEHYMYYIDKPERMSYTDGNDIEHFRLLIKKHIITYGPVLGGFLVFKNFMNGAFTKVNGGIYFEDGIYDKGKMHFQPGYTQNVSNYAGSHAVSIIGWGEENVVVDNKGTKKTVPYWFCSNSWTDKWGENGKFKMAMYPYNKLSQFDKQVSIVSPKLRQQAGGFILLKASKPPKKTKIKQIPDSTSMKKLHSAKYYKGGQEKIIKPSPSSSSKSKHILIGIGIVILGICVLIGLYFLIKFIKEKLSSKSRRKRSYYNPQYNSQYPQYNSQYPQYNSQYNSQYPQYNAQYNAQYNSQYPQYNAHNVIENIYGHQ